MIFVGSCACYYTVAQNNFVHPVFCGFIGTIVFSLYEEGMYMQYLGKYHICSNSIDTT